MAEYSNEFWQDLEEKNLVFLQAFIRGYVVRKCLQSLRTEFEVVCQEIERKPLDIEWSRNCASLPRIRRDKHRKNKAIKLGTEPINKIPEKLSVEIQTDFDDAIIPVHTTAPASEELITTIDKVTDIPKHEHVGAGTLSDPVIIDNNSLLFNKNKKPENEEHYEMIDEKLDIIPVRDSPPQISQRAIDQSDIENDRNRPISNLESVNISKVDISGVDDMTSVWEAETSILQNNTEEIVLPTNKTELNELRKSLAMELLWIQQAIQSRKNYLKLKNQMM